MPRMPPDYLKGRKCSKCGSDKTYIDSSGHPVWRRYKDNKGCWDKKSYLCSKCYYDDYYSSVKKYDANSQAHIKKYLTNSRTGNLDRCSDHGKSVISQWIAAKKLGLKDLNIVNDNFVESIDLSENSLYNRPDVKSASFNEIKECWSISTFNDCGTLIVLCMDQERPWKDVVRVYIIPKSDITLQ